MNGATACLTCFLFRSLASFSFSFSCLTVLIRRPPHTLPYFSTRAQTLYISLCQSAKATATLTATAIKRIRQQHVLQTAENTIVFSTNQSLMHSRNHRHCRTVQVYDHVLALTSSLTCSDDGTQKENCCAHRTASHGTHDSAADEYTIVGSIDLAED